MLREKGTEVSERLPICPEQESSKPRVSASSREMTIILRAFDFSRSQRDKCDAGARAHSGKQYSIGY